MLDELQNRLAFLEKRLTVLEREVSSLKAARRDAPRNESVALPYRLPCDAPGLLIANGHDVDPNDYAGKWRWVGNDGPIQFVLPFGLGEDATARIVLADHPRVDLSSMRVYVNDKPVAHSLESDGAARQALLVPLEPSPLTVDITLDCIKSISLKQIKQGEDTRPLAFKFFGMEIFARGPGPDPVAPEIRPFEPEPEVIDGSFRFGLSRLDERLPQTGQYRHLDLSLFDARLKDNRWDRIKFKFASFEGSNYLEFRSQANWPEFFRHWPGTEQDDISKLVKAPDPRTATMPEFPDPHDLEAVRALFENLDQIVRTVTTDIDAPHAEIELWRDEARTLADRALSLLIAGPKPFEPPAAAPFAEGEPEPGGVDVSIRFGDMRLDERLPQTGQYRHLDISIFDTRLKDNHWERIKFKFASFEGDTYLEFRDRPDRLPVFRVWPGTQEDEISRLLNIPEPKSADVPEFRDATDLEISRALFENLDLIVHTVTTGLDAPHDEIELWREEARALADRALPLLCTLEPAQLL